ncbi:MAG: membrane dipeptidase [Anaerolineae bacterium]|nr:membrane dipeptidase [Anaerolineae bacterium]
MIIVDAHQDIAWVSIKTGRDYRISALKHRQNEVGQNTSAATIGLPDSLLGRVAFIFATLFAAPAKNSRAVQLSGGMAYRDAKEAYTIAMRQVDYYQRLNDEEERIHLIRSAEDIDIVLETWQDGTELHQRKQGLVILMEGADPILEPKQFEEWYERGVRIVGTAWGETRYSGGTGAPGGLSFLGNDLLDVLAGYHAILDLSHMAEQSFYEALDRYEGVIIASHSNPRRFCDTDRHLSDDMIRRLAERDGVMGVVLYNKFLKRTWSKGTARLPLSIAADVIDHVCQITGSAAHVGIGSDFDGGFGAESIPEEIETSGDLLEIAQILRERGYEASDIEAIMGGNMLRKLRESLTT